MSGRTGTGGMKVRSGYGRGRQDHPWDGTVAEHSLVTATERAKRREKNQERADKRLHFRMYRPKHGRQARQARQ